MIVEELAKFIIKLNYSSIPKPIINKTKLCFTDFLATASGGFNEKSTKIALKTLKKYSNPQGNVSILSFNEDTKFTPMDAAFLNALATHSKDLDDGDRFAYIHPASSVFPTALAISEELNINSTEFLSSVIAGYEVAILLGKLFNPQHRNRSFHSTGTIGHFASVATASYLLKLNKNQIAYAFGLAGTQAAGLLESDHSGSMAKHIHPGVASRNGLLSAFLAKEGFTGSSDILESDQGFIKAMVGNLNLESVDNSVGLEAYLSDDLRNKNLLKKYLKENLGQYLIKNVYLKKYPVCRHIHSSIDAVIAILDEIKNLSLEEEFNYRNIDEIQVYTYKIAAEHNNYHPKTKEDIRQSLPFSLAITLVRGELDSNYLDDICKFINYSPREKDEDLDDNLIYELDCIESISNKVIINTYEEFDDLQPYKRPSFVRIVFKEDVIKPSDVDLGFKPLVFKDNFKTIEENKIIKFQNGRFILEKLVLLPLGEMENPFSKKDVLDKFKSLNKAISDNKLNLIQNAIDNLENYTVNEFMDVFKNEF